MTTNSRLQRALELAYPPDDDDHVDLCKQLMLRGQCYAIASLLLKLVDLDECAAAAQPAPSLPPNDPITGYCSLHNELEPCDSCASPAPAPASPSVEPERELTRDECWEAYLRTKEAFIRLGESRDTLKARVEWEEAERLKLLRYYGPAPESAESVNPEVVELKARIQQLEGELSETQSLLLAATNQRDEARGQLADEKAAHEVTRSKLDEEAGSRDALDPPGSPEPVGET